MSKIFYDHLMQFGNLSKFIGTQEITNEEKQELWKIVDETVHNRVITTILDKLPLAHHSEFLEKIASSPHDVHILTYLTEKIGEDVEVLIGNDLALIESEILQLVSEV